jgi:hypothetical protein
MYRKSQLLTLGCPRGYTAESMKARRALLVAGSVWELARFFLVLFLFAAVLKATAGAGPWVFPWLLVAGSGNLLIAAGAILLALFPARYAPIAALLRLGKLMSVFAFILLAISGALRLAYGFEVVGVGHRMLTAGLVLAVVFLLDLVFLAVLVRWRPEEHTAAEPTSEGEEKLPEYHETEVQNFH